MVSVVDGDVLPCDRVAVRSALTYASTNPFDSDAMVKGLIVSVTLKFSGVRTLR